MLSTSAKAPNPKIPISPKGLFLGYFSVTPTPQGDIFEAFLFE